MHAAVPASGGHGRYLHIVGVVAKMVALLEGRDPAGATCVVMNGNIVCVYTDQKMEDDHGCHHELVERMGALIHRAAMIYGLSRATPVSAIIKMQSFHNLQAEVVSADFAQSFPAFAQPMHEIIHDVFTPCAACLSASEQSARTEHHEEGGLNGLARAMERRAGELTGGRGERDVGRMHLATARGGERGGPGRGRRPGLGLDLVALRAKRHAAPPAAPMPRRGSHSGGVPRAQLRTNANCPRQERAGLEEEKGSLLTVLWRDPCSVECAALGLSGRS